MSVETTPNGVTANLGRHRRAVCASIPSVRRLKRALLRGRAQLLSAHSTASQTGQPCTAMRTRLDSLRNGGETFGRL